MMERRGVIRTRISFPASIIPRGGVLVWDCRVLDITSRGARLELADAPAIPIQFSLTFDSGKTLRDCDLIWRIAIKLTWAFGCLKRTSNDRLKQMKTVFTQAVPRSEKLPRRKEQRHSVGRLTRFLARPPFRDALGHKGWFSRLSRAEPHVVHHLGLKIPGWPRFSRPMRIAFLSDFHTGSHSDDVTRLNAIIAEASAFRPDLALFGGDYVNMQLFGGGRVPPRTIATAICRLDAALGQFAVLGNHDYEYGALAVAGALEGQKINVLSNSRVTVQFQNNAVNIIGVPNARITSTEARAILAGIEPNTPTIVLAHDPVWFAEVPSGPHLTLAGHTHGGQIRIPGIGVITNASKAPLRWSNGLISERGKHLYVTSGIGTSGIPLRWGVPPGYAILDVIGE